MNLYVYIVKRNKENFGCSLDPNTAKSIFNNECEYLKTKNGEPIFSGEYVALFKTNLVDGTNVLLEIVKEVLI